MIIEELQDRKIRWYEPKDQVREEPLLEYVWEVALEFAPAPDQSNDSYAPYTFVNRYAERNLTNEEKYIRHKEMYNTKLSFEEFVKKQDKSLDDKYKETFLKNTNLQNTIEAFGLDVSKFWYLLLFVHDFIEDFATDAPTPYNNTMKEFNLFKETLDEATSIKLNKNGRKSYETDREDIIALIKTAINYFAISYNNILDNIPIREQRKHLKEIGLNNYIEDWKIPVDFENTTSLSPSHKKWYFTKMFHYFLRDRKAKALPHVTDRVSTDKYMFISRLIYTVGYHGKEYNIDKNLKTNNNNRMLSNLLRKYANEEFPTVIHKVY